MHIIVLAVLVAAAGASAMWWTAANGWQLGNAAAAFAICCVMMALASAANAPARIDGATLRHARCAARLNAVLLAIAYFWGSVSVALSYYLTELDWHHANQYAIYLAVPALIAAGYGLSIGATRRKHRSITLIRAARGLTVVQLMVMAGAILYMVVNDKVLQTAPDWAAMNVFLFGATAIGVMSVMALFAQGPLEDRLARA